MTRKERLASLFEAFDRLAERFCEDTQGLCCEIGTVYKKENTEDPEKLRFRLARVWYRAYFLEFKYTARSSMNVSQSILECLIYPEKAPDGIAIPLPLFLDYCGIDEETPLCIPMISTEESMEEAFDCICTVLRTHEDALRDVCESEEGRERVLLTFRQEVVRLLDIDVDPVSEAYEVFPYLNPALYDFFTARFLSAPFLNELRGDRQAAIRQLRRLKKKLGYEVRLLRLWESDRTPSPSLPRTREILCAAYTKGGTPRTPAKELLAMLIAWMLLTLVLIPVYGGIYLLLHLWEGVGAVYHLASSENVAYSICFAFITAICASYFLRFLILKPLYPKDYERQLALDHLQNGKGSDRLIKVLLHALVLISLLLSLLLAKWDVKFIENGFVDNSDFFSLTGEYHAYGEIECLYYKPDRLNDFGETINTPSYVLRLKDGKEIDLFPLAEIEEYGPTLLELLEEKGVRIERSSASPPNQP